MGWFGGSSEPESPSEKGFSDGGGAGFSDAPNMYGGGGGGGVSEFQEFSLNLQQQVLVQQVITELSHKAFEKCCGSNSTRDSALTGKEVACVRSITNKWLDANEYLAGRLQRKQQAQGGGGEQQFG